MKNLTKTKQEQIIKQELNISKWPIFSSSSDYRKSKTIIRKIFLEGGNEVTREVMIGKVGEIEVGLLHIFDYKVFSVLTDLWEKSGNEVDQEVYFHLNTIIQRLNLQRGGNIHRKIKDSLMKLRTIPLIWKNSFYNKSKDVHDSEIRPTYLLDDLAIFEREKKIDDSNNQLYLQMSSFKINQKILLNLKNKYSKPFLLDEVISLEKDTSILLYNYLDLLMYKQKQFKKSTQKILKDLGLTEYQYKSKRRQILEPALKELVNKKLTSGIISHYEFIENSHEKDFDVVIYKKSFQETENAGQDEKSQMILDYFKQKFPDQIPATNIVTDLLKNYELEQIMQNLARIEKNKKIKNPIGMLKSSLDQNWILNETDDELKQKTKEQQQLQKNQQLKKVQQLNSLLQKDEEETKRLQEEFLSLPITYQEHIRKEAISRIEKKSQHAYNPKHFLFSELSIQNEIEAIMKEAECNN